MTQLSLKKIYSGKVRDLYEIDDKRMLMVASDRLSAFDVILDDPIPRKGEILTQISNFWFNKLAHIMPNHFTGDSVYDVLPKEEADLVKLRQVNYLNQFLRHQVKKNWVITILILAMRNVKKLLVQN